MCIISVLIEVLGVDACKPVELCFVWSLLVTCCDWVTFILGCGRSSRAECTLGVGELQISFT